VEHNEHDCLMVTRREYLLLFYIDVYGALCVGCKERLGCWPRELWAPRSPFEVVVAVVI
jgi:hypothetical protein